MSDRLRDPLRHNAWDTEDLDDLERMAGDMARFWDELVAGAREPPDLDGWSYGMATGRFREIPPRP